MERIFAADTITRIGEGTFPWSPKQSFDSIGSVVSTIVTNAIVLAGVIAFLFVIIGGFSIIMAANTGDPKKLEQGKQTILMALVGLLLVFFSFWIIQALGIILGFNPLQVPTQ